jgi:hypothetical protein
MPPDELKQQDGQETGSEHPRQTLSGTLPAPVHTTRDPEPQPSGGKGRGSAFVRPGLSAGLILIAFSLAFYMVSQNYTSAAAWVAVIIATIAAWLVMSGV